MTQSPKGFAAGDVILDRYVGNSFPNGRDPSGNEQDGTLSYLYNSFGPLRWGIDVLETTGRISAGAMYAVSQAPEQIYYTSRDIAVSARSVGTQIAWWHNDIYVPELKSTLFGGFDQTVRSGGNVGEAWARSVAGALTLNASEVAISGIDWARGNGSAEDFGQALGGFGLSVAMMGVGRLAGASGAPVTFGKLTVGTALREGAGILGGNLLDLVAPGRQLLYKPANFVLSKAIHDSPISRTFLHEPLTTLADKLGFKVCFAGETKLVAKGAWGEGLRRIDQITLADEVASRDENDPNGPIEWKKVEELFERFGPILHLHLAGGKLIRTTPEHPFFEYNRGWTEAGALQPGDTIRTDNGWVKVEEAFATDTFETVYNLKVSEYHTYFVGGEDWGFSVWAHNADCGIERKVHKFADGAEADSVVVAYRFKKGDLTEAQRAAIQRKYAKANELLASGDEVAHVPAAGPVRNDRNARRRYIRDTDAPTDPATGRLVPMDEIKNPPGVQVDEFVGVAWGGKARIENQHYLDTSTNLALGGKDKAVFRQLREQGLTGVRVREFRVIFED